MLPGLSSTIAAVSFGGGVVPNAVNWNDVAISGAYEAFGFTNSQTITGISVPIYLRAEISSYSGVDGAATLVAGSDGDVGVANGAYIDFLASPDESVTFGVFWTDYSSFTVTVKYKSAGSSTFDQTLDTFTATRS